jgi:2-methylcitrate dehydratase PrpD
VIPAALSLAEKSGADGKRLITAIVSGYEADIRIGEAVGPSHYNYWHNTGTCGAFGAAAASGNILGLNRDQMANALGSAGTQTSGLWQFMAEKAMSKHLHPGRAASTGVISALLAKHGFTGSTTILEGDRGFFKATSSDSDPTKITEGLGEKYKILETSFKPHASCRHTHSPVDAALIIRERDKIESDDIESVRIGTYPDTLKIAGIEDPKKPYEAKFSLKYCVSTALLRGKLGLEEFNESLLREPRIRDLMKKCEVKISPALSGMYPAKWPAEIEMITKTGKRYRANVDYPLGDPENPVSREKLVDKFRSLAGGVFSKEKVERIIEIIFRLDEVSDIRQLTKLITKNLI